LHSSAALRAEEAATSPKVSKLADDILQLNVLETVELVQKLQVRAAVRDFSSRCLFGPA
jgi:hypothetical protein